MELFPPTSSNSTATTAVVIIVQVLITTALCWVLHYAMRWLLERLLGSKKFHMLKETEKRTAQLELGSSVVYLVIVPLYLHGIYSLHDTVHSRWEETAASTYLGLIIMIGYTIYEEILYLMYGKELIYHFHHCLTIFASAIVCGYPRVYFYISWIGTVETTGLFVNAFLLAKQYKDAYVSNSMTDNNNYINENGNGQGTSSGADNEVANTVTNRKIDPKDDVMKRNGNSSSINEVIQTDKIADINKINGDQKSNTTGIHSQMKKTDARDLSTAQVSEDLVSRMTFRVNILGALMWLSFLIFRVISMSILIVLLVKDSVDKTELTINRISALFLILICVAFSSIYCLSLFWFYKMTIGMLKILNKAKRIHLDNPPPSEGGLSPRNSNQLVADSRRGSKLDIEMNSSGGINASDTMSVKDNIECIVKEILNNNDTGQDDNNNVVND